MRAEANEKTSVKILQLPDVMLSIKGGDLSLNSISIISSRMKPGNSLAQLRASASSLCGGGKNAQGTFLRREKGQ